MDAPEGCVAKKNSDQLPVLNRLTDIFAVGKFDYGIMVLYQNFTRKSELIRAPLGPGYDVPPEPPSQKPWSLAITSSEILERETFH